jgi:radial spoke head protein 3
MSRQQMMQEQEHQHAEMLESQKNEWDELSDYENMVDERQLEPDYYIDRPPSPIFVPNPEGDPKLIQVNDRDNDLFDFELEAEPVLQVLVGKALELAQIEAIEAFEKTELDKHKRLFLQIKEAELMETQRMEAARKRRIEEQERRNLQQRTTKSQKVNAEKKVMARQTAKDFLFLFKRDSLKIMTDEGLLRRPRDFSIHSTFIPQLYG